MQVGPGARTSTVDYLASGLPRPQPHPRISAMTRGVTLARSAACAWSRLHRVNALSCSIWHPPCRCARAMKSSRASCARLAASAAPRMRRTTAAETTTAAGQPGGGKGTLISFAAARAVCASRPRPHRRRRRRRPRRCRPCHPRSHRLLPRLVASALQSLYASFSSSPLCSLYGCDALRAACAPSRGVPPRRPRAAAHGRLSFRVSSSRRARSSRHAATRAGTTCLLHWPRLRHHCRWTAPSPRAAQLRTWQLPIREMVNRGRAASGAE